MVFDQLEQVKKILDLGRIETGVDLVKIPFAFLHEILVFFCQLQGFLEIPGKVFLKTDGDLEFSVGFARIQNVLEFFFLDQLPGIHGPIIIQPRDIVKPGEQGEKLSLYSLRPHRSTQA